MSDVVDQKSVLSRLVMFLYRLEIVAPFLTCMLVQNVLNQSATPHQRASSLSRSLRV